jgi:hypothetical protein
MAIVFLAFPALGAAEPAPVFATVASVKVAARPSSV